MARNKDVVFSSERLESRERLKKILIPLAVLAAIAVIVVVAALLTRALKVTYYTGGEDTPYPYRWYNKKGVMTLEIDSSAAEGRSWVAVNNDRAHIPTEATKKQPKKASRFTLAPNEEGRHSVLFVLLNENDEAGTILEMLTETALDEQGFLQTEVVSSSLTNRQKAQQGGEDTYFPYSFSADSDGLIAVTVSGGAVVNDWVCVSDNEEAVIYAGVFYEDEDVLLYLYPGDVPGSSSVTLSSENGAVSIALVAEYAENGDFLIIEHGIEGGYDDPAPAEEEEEPGTEPGSEDEPLTDAPVSEEQAQAEEYARRLQEIIDSAPDTVTMMRMLDELDAEYGV